MSKELKTNICYLCGEKIIGRSTKDHVPPEQIFSTELRKVNYNLQLLTLPVHKKCNEEYGKDEEYFYHSMSPLVYKTPGGKQIFRELGKKLKRDENRRIGLMVEKEFGKLSSVDGTVIKNFDNRRIFRVVWKIVRGLCFFETNNFLPNDIFPKKCHSDPEVHTKKSYAWSSELVKIIHETTELKGRNPEYFYYKYFNFKENNFNICFWNLYFWDGILFHLNFHDINCQCDECREEKT